MYDVLDVAYYILHKYSKKYVFGISKLSLCLYYLQVTYLVKYKERLFKEDVYAVDWGIEINEIRSEYGMYIPHIPYCVIEERDVHINDEDKKNIDEFIEEYAGNSVIYFARFIHNQLPWKRAFRRYNNKIYDNEIIEYFSD